MKTRIAVIDDEITVCRRLKAFLDGEGYETESFDRGVPFLERMADTPFDVVFLDLGLPDADGMEILRRLIGHYDDVEVIIITGQGSIDSAVEAIKQGAYHYVTKPFRLSEIGSLAGSAAKKLALKKENRRLRETLGGEDILPEFCGSSRAMQEIIAMVKKVAPVDCNVLLQGESGTGKELVARSIHRLSPRRERPFVSFNCGGFTEELICNELFGHEKGAFTGATATKIGLLESGAGGTVFLDEIGEMPMSMQVRLLRVLQEKQILRVGGTKPITLNIRIVAASNKDIKKACTQGTFREDLYYRLNVVSLQLPSLAERKEDIPLLVGSFMTKYNTLFGKTIKKISPQAMDILMRYNFPGNVRELENIIQRAVALAEGEDIRVTGLPADLQNLEFDTIEGEGLMTMEEMEKLHIMRVLDRTHHNKALTSKILNLPRTTLWRKMRKYGLVKNRR
ncbi:MAG: sigma-54-dependent Fis family transcriptional regulator [Deltaproteobacteria bacterium]|nr:sigma-54-dependent Fis family transcriptional regulator [Deltaproteobacteria bacterium]